MAFIVTPIVTITPHRTGRHGSSTQRKFQDGKLGKGRRSREGKNKDPCKTLSLQNPPDSTRGLLFLSNKVNFGGLPLQIKSDNEGFFPIPSLDLEVLVALECPSPTTSSILNVSTVTATPELELWGWSSDYKLNNLLRQRKFQLGYSIPKSEHKTSAEGAQGIFIQWEPLLSPFC